MGNTQSIRAYIQEEFKKANQGQRDYLVLFSFIIYLSLYLFHQGT